MRLATALQDVSKAVFGLRLNGTKLCVTRVDQDSSPRTLRLREVAAKMVHVAVPDAAE